MVAMAVDTIVLTIAAIRMPSSKPATTNPSRLFPSHMIVASAFQAFFNL